MNYVDSFNFLGIEAKQIPCIIGSGEPKIDTSHKEGLLYIDKSNTRIYKCINTSKGLVWIPIIISHDWLQNDSNKDDYIKNRPFYSIGNWIEVHNKSDSVSGQHPITGNVSGSVTTEGITILERYPVGTMCKVLFNEDEYFATIKNTNGIKYIGNGGLISNSGIEYTDETFVVYSGGLDIISYIFKPSNPLDSFFVKICLYALENEQIHKLDARYLPDDVVKKDDLNKLEIVGRKGTGVNSEIFNSPDNVADGENSHAEGLTTRTYKDADASHAEGEQTIAYSVGSHAEGMKTKAGGISDDDIGGSYAHAEGVESEAYGRGSHAEGESTYAKGDYSHAEGGNCAASGKYSHAEGCNDQNGHATIAKGMASHAEGAGSNANGYGSHSEGNSTIAEGDYSHAEGYESKAIGGVTHAEGFKTVANGLRSHVEGIQSETGSEGTAAHAEGWGTHANGAGSHSEGIYTYANGIYSHAEGGDTIATAAYSHVQGKYNEEDTEKKYAHIVGGGSSDNRKNIHTVDWNGNAWYEGGIKVGGRSQDDESALPVLTRLDTKPLLLNEDMKDTYLTDPTYGDTALECIKAGRQILVKVPNTVSGGYTVNYSPVYMYQVPNHENNFLYLFYLTDRKNNIDLTQLGLGIIQVPIHDQLKMILSETYNSNPLEE